MRVIFIFIVIFSSFVVFANKKKKNKKKIQNKIATSVSTDSCTNFFKFLNQKTPKKINDFFFYQTKYNSDTLENLIHQYNNCLISIPINKIDSIIGQPIIDRSNNKYRLTYNLIDSYDSAYIYILGADYDMTLIKNKRGHQKQIVFRFKNNSILDCSYRVGYAPKGID